MDGPGVPLRSTPGIVDEIFKAREAADSADHVAASAIGRSADSASFFG